MRLRAAVHPGPAAPLPAARCRSYVPAPRETEADRANDRRSLKRRLDQRLFMLVKPKGGSWALMQQGDCSKAVWGGGRAGQQAAGASRPGGSRHRAALAWMPAPASLLLAHVAATAAQPSCPLLACAPCPTNRKCGGRDDAADSRARAGGSSGHLCGAGALPPSCCTSLTAPLGCTAVPHARSRLLLRACPGEAGPAAASHSLCCCAPHARMPAHPPVCLCPCARLALLQPYFVGNAPAGHVQLGDGATFFHRWVPGWLLAGSGG